MNVLLCADKLSISIQDRILVAGLDLAIAPGEHWAVLGPNGTGKTSLLHTLAGLRRPTQGQVAWRGAPLGDIPRRTLAKALGLLLQDDAAPFPATVLETVLTGRHPHMGAFGWESDHDLAVARQALADVDLAGLSSRPIGSLSGGERRRLAIATLLVQAPCVALLDEPTNHLDLRHQAHLMTLLSGRFGGDDHALLSVLHDPTLALSHCTHALLLHGDGRWQAGTADALLTADTLSTLYQQPLQLVQHGAARAFIPAPSI